MPHQFVMHYLFIKIFFIHYKARNGKDEIKIARKDERKKY